MYKLTYIQLEENLKNKLIQSAKKHRRTLKAEINYLLEDILNHENTGHQVIEKVDAFKSDT